MTNDKERISKKTKEKKDKMAKKVRIMKNMPRKK